MEPDTRKTRTDLAKAKVSPEARRMSWPLLLIIAVLVALVMAFLARFASTHTCVDRPPVVQGEAWQKCDAEAP